jgi:hypothetical protein
MHVISALRLQRDIDAERFHERLRPRAGGNHDTIGDERRTLFEPDMDAIARGDDRGRAIADRRSAALEHVIEKAAHKPRWIGHIAVLGLKDTVPERWRQGRHQRVKLRRIEHLEHGAAIAAHLPLAAPRSKPCVSRYTTSEPLCRISDSGVRRRQQRPVAVVDGSVQRAQRVGDLRDDVARPAAMKRISHGAARNA